jgi:hypothetical protein
LLLSWDLTANPNGQNLTNQHQHFVGTGIGFAIRNLHSTLGISLEVWELLRHSAISCSVCLCVFSAEGYQDHLDKEGTCRNWFFPCKASGDLIAGNAPLKLIDALAAPQLQPAGSLTPELVWDINEQKSAAAEEWWDKEGPTRAALLEWNSRIGINQNVWALVSTMGILCQDCSRVRSAPAHRRHKCHA